MACCRPNCALLCITPFSCVTSLYILTSQRRGCQLLATRLHHTVARFAEMLLCSDGFTCASNPSNLLPPRFTASALSVDSPVESLAAVSRFQVLAVRASLMVLQMQSLLAPVQSWLAAK